MPLYEYHCESCDRQFEYMQRITDTPYRTCFECGGPLTKLVSQTSFQLKGSGWYATDYGRSTSGSNGKRDGEKRDGEKRDGEKKSEGGAKSSVTEVKSSGSSSGSDSKD
jgi:putative FmdB family regulatory protein